MVKEKQTTKGNNMYKVKVISKEILAELYPNVINANPNDFVKGGELKNIIITTLYIKALLGEEKVLISKLAKGYDKKDVLKYYGFILEASKNCVAKGN